MLDALAPGGAWFFRQLAQQVGSTDDKALSATLWDLVWAGRISNDTLTPLRALTRSGTPSHRTKRPPARPRMATTHRSRRRLDAHRTARDRRPLGAAPRARHRPDPPRARGGRAAARPARRRDPRRGGQRAAAGRLRCGLQGALGVRGLRPLSARLLRGGAGRRPVRYGGRDRPVAHLQRGRRRRQADVGLPGRHRPGQSLRRGPPLAAEDGRDKATEAIARAARPVRWWSWSTASSSSTSSAAAAPC